MTTVLIGGTGTLGKCLLGKLVARGTDVIVFSRGEHAQKSLAGVYKNVRFVIGDVRDESAVKAVTRGASCVYHLAAMKHVDIAQANPLEAIKTNVIGAVNIGNACVSNKVKHLVYSNTDKAILPITTYGYSKAIARDYLMSLRDVATVVYVWGNVIGSQGSFIPVIASAMRASVPVPLTDARMTRFWIRIGDAADFMLVPREPGEYMPPVKGASVLRVVESVGRILGMPYRIKFTGIRGVEKLHECLETKHEHCVRSDTCPQYTDAELDEMIRPIVEATA